VDCSDGSFAIRDVEFHGFAHSSALRILILLLFANRKTRISTSLRYVLVVSWCSNGRI
jgi:hypothetical protein